MISKECSSNFRWIEFFSSRMYGMYYIVVWRISLPKNTNLIERVISLMAYWRIVNTINEGSFIIFSHILSEGLQFFRNISLMKSSITSLFVYFVNIFYAQNGIFQWKPNSWINMLDYVHYLKWKFDQRDKIYVYSELCHKTYKTHTS